MSSGAWKLFQSYEEERQTGTYDVGVDKRGRTLVVMNISSRGTELSSMARPTSASF